MTTPPTTPPTTSATPNVVASSAPEAQPVAHTETVTVPAIPAQPTPQQHASRWHLVFSVLEGLLAIGTTPEVMKHLSPKQQGYIAAISVVDQVAQASSNTQANP